MDVKIITLPEKKVLGVPVRFVPGETDARELRKRFFDPRAGAATALSESGDIYRVYYGTGQGRWSDHVIGMLAREGIKPPYGMVLRPLPEGTYARFECTVGTVSDTWRTIYADWLPHAGYVEDESRPSWEVVPGGLQNDSDAAAILLPVTPKAA